MESLIPSLPTGLQPVPIGPYLNGIFPDQTPGTGSGSGNWALVNAYPNLLFADPLSMVQLPDTSGFYIAGKQGCVWKISNDSTTALRNTVLDISSTVHTDGDAGLINMILHPEFGVVTSPNRGFAYLIYRYHPMDDAIGACDAEAYTRLSRFTKPDGQEKFDPSSELVLVQQHDSHCWHTGGAMFFNQQVLFYFAFGDMGGADDVYKKSQSDFRLNFRSGHIVEYIQNGQITAELSWHLQEKPGSALLLMTT